MRPADEKHHQIPTPTMERTRKLRELAFRLLAPIATRRLWRLAFRLGLLALIFPVILQWVIAYIVANDARLLPAQLQGARSLLIVTAHPDDECLFFAPSILGVLDANPRVKAGLLALSIGNNDGIGELRKNELELSCASLGIDAKRCVALDRPELQDDPKVWWDTRVIESIVAEHVKKWEVDAIITFDSGGVSGHINHRAVSSAMIHYAATNKASPEVYTLTSTNLLRKYTFLGDLPLTSLPFSWGIINAIFVPSHAEKGDRALLASSWSRYRKTRVAFARHNSQYSWDRHLYMILSRYVWFNDLTRIERE